MSAHLVQVITITVAALLLLTSLLSLAHEKSADVNAVTAWEYIEQGATIIDVRSAEEFASGHLEGAKNIPFDNIVSGVSKLELAKDSKILLYCRSGRRSAIAQASLIEAGYSATLNGGGYDSLTVKPEAAH
ncbi:rhodanese-like domain-containing protein [Shewanella sp. SR44-3]|nr:rhodanese-like domain-containing protein [Shewanella sp. SR44-3]